VRRYRDSSPRSSRQSVAKKTTIYITVFILAVLALACSAGNASASKQIVDYFGSESASGTRGGEFEAPAGIAINSSGAGPANKGDVYVVDSGNNRIERFGHDDAGTLADSSDDTYPFISAWGAGVNGQIDRDEYQICTIASQCQAGASAAGGGSIGSTFLGLGVGTRKASGIAVDQDTGDVYVVDGANFRVNVYQGDGTFLRAFGFDVIASGPGDNGVGYEVCVAAMGDVCKAGVPGAGEGQLGGGARTTYYDIAVSQPDGNPGTGTAFVADDANDRVDTFDLDGSSPSFFGSVAIFDQNGNWWEPKSLAVDSRGIVYVSNHFGPGNGTTEIERYDSENANGGGVTFLPPIPGDLAGVYVAPDIDAGGPDTDILYVLKANGTVFQYGPINSPGLTSPPTTTDDVHGAVSFLAGVGDLAVDEDTERLFVTAEAYASTSEHNIGVSQAASGVYILDNPSPAPTASLDSLSDITATSATVNATIDPNGPPALTYHLEYSLDGTTWEATPSVVLGSQKDPQSVNAVLAPRGGLEPNTSYHVRLYVKRPFTDPIITTAASFVTSTAVPQVETVGSPVRTTTTADLEARIHPRNSATSYRFEYSSQGPCDANPCLSTELLPAGSGDEVVLVAQRIGDLLPNTTYHYRVSADNGNPGSPVYGQDMTVMTRASDVPLEHGRLPGPPDSDRGWEQVNQPDTGGNPVAYTIGFSSNGDRALFRIAGGTPISESGSLFSLFYAERTSTGWQTKQVSPPRNQLIGTRWEAIVGSDDLSSIAAVNNEYTTNEATVWNLNPAGQPNKLFELSPQQTYYNPPRMGISANGKRVVALERGPGLDPAYPGAAGAPNLYDISSGSPHLVSVLPDGSVSRCGALDAGGVVALPKRTSNWISADGSLVFFRSCENFYVRDIEAGTTKSISEPISGQRCATTFLKSTSDAAFLMTATRLTADDTNPPAICGAKNRDIYRYDLAEGALECLTCSSGVSADVTDAEVSEGGSRIYFTSAARLLAGAPKFGQSGAYRLDVGTGNLAFVAPLSEIGDRSTSSNAAISPNGSIFAFRSNAPGLNAKGGLSNGGTAQYYLYDDQDRSLICVSCPQTGSAPVADAAPNFGYLEADSGPNQTILSNNGIVAFVTPTPLVRADQNTAAPNQKPEVGADAYEWRDGHPLLLTDGLSSWTESPRIAGVSPSGRDVFFSAPAQYTPDALDGYRRLYDARIGGGFEFPAARKPCPLEVCQGTPRGAPEEQAPGSGTFVGPSSSAKKPPSCHKGKRRHGSRCIAKKHVHRHHDNRTHKNRRAAR
jgi:hypothetical protein